MSSASTLTLARVAEGLGWPSETEILAPSGAGPAVFAALARTKIGRALERLDDRASWRIGILSNHLDQDETEGPLGIVVEFESKASDLLLEELQRLAWNFSYSAVLVTIEPHLLRVWSCCETPVRGRPLDRAVVHQLTAAELNEAGDNALQLRAARALHWLNLVSGAFLADNSKRFRRDGRADQMLLGNLGAMRVRLQKAGLTDDDICHDLLARVIFVQFLFDRRDANGDAALNKAKIEELRSLGVLQRDYDGLPDILEDYEDAYRLFDWLNVRFNGDLFPGKGATAEERRAGWSVERDVVTPDHLSLLAQFLRGDMDLGTGQLCLWPLYSFDVIPLEFISSIYETFVSERASDEGIFYTPPHLVDFVLDQVLPWRGVEWDLRILDPACGSGIFLVKAFQRLVHRWKTAHPGKAIGADVMHRLLTDNLLGVDKDQHAVRVACFSLYLAMCDELEPRRYWTEVHFPTMRGERLICSDFFEEKAGFRTPAAVGGDFEPHYDLILGNAPWGKGLLTARALDWSVEPSNAWPVANKDIGCLFLAKSARLLAPGGWLAMIQSAASLLFNQGEPAARFRRKLFSSHSVEAIYNLSALRFSMFGGKRHTPKVSVSPACVVVLRQDGPRPDDVIAYVSPRNPPSAVEQATIVIEPGDYRWIPAETAATDAGVWTALMWGTPRDMVLLEKLQRGPTLALRIAAGAARSREGIISGDRKMSFPALAGRRLLSANRFPTDSPVYLDAQDVPVADHVPADGKASTNFAAFALPQLLIKQGWQLKSGRFQARLVRDASEGLLSSQSYVTVNADAETLAAACLTYNSALAVYFLQLTSGRMATYRPETTVADLLRVPLPPRPVDLNVIVGPEDFDREVFDAFGLKAAERALVEDMVEVTIPDFRAVSDRPGLRSTRSVVEDLFAPEADLEPELTLYAEYFIRVLQAGFGRTRGVRANIFRTGGDERLPFRLISFELVDAQEAKGVRHVNVDCARLLTQMQGLARAQQKSAASTRTMLARIYDGDAASPAIHILKPDAVRYWTRTAALNDADEVSADLFQALETARSEAPKS